MSSFKLLSCAITDRIKLSDICIYIINCTLIQLLILLFFIFLFQYGEFINDFDLNQDAVRLTDLDNFFEEIEPAIEIFQKALPEHHNPDTLKKQYDAEQAKRELGLQEFLDTKLANVEHEKGIPF